MTAVILVVGFVPQGAQALIGTTAGNIVKITAPPSVAPGALQDATNVFAFNERQGVTLASLMRVDITGPGLYDQPGDIAGSGIAVNVPAGTVVDSHLIHSDLPTGGTVIRNFTVTFPTDILGIIVVQGKLVDSDVLGAPGTVYAGTNRGLDLGLTGAGRDAVTVVDQRTIQVALRTASTDGMDQIRVLTKHNAPPTANAGGPYAGTEGSPVTLSGSAVDPDHDALTPSWSLTHTGAPGTTCSMTNSGTFTPSISCTDDALVTATLSVTDGVNTPVTTSAQVSIGNVAPSLGTLAVPTTAIALGSSASVSLPFTDAGTHDTHTATVAWGDTTSSAGTVTEAAGGGSVGAAHTYGAPGLYTITVTVSDDDHGTAVSNAQIYVNGPPTADSGGPYSGSEGLPTALAGTAVDPEGDPVAVSWSFVPGALDPGGSCSSAGTATLTPSVTCTDDAVVAADLTASDGINPPVVSSTTIAVANQPPSLGALAVTGGAIAPGTTVSVAAPFTDGGSNDTHTASVDWGDLTHSDATIGESGGNGSLSAGHAYTSPGVYSVTVTLTDDDLGTDVRTATVVVNSPPEVSAGGPYAGLEGSPLSLAATATDADGDPLTISWSFAVAGGAGTVCTPIGAGTLTPTLTCNDDATVTATVSASDGVNPPVVSSTTIAVGNTAPVLGGAVASATTAPRGSTISVGLTFSDQGPNDSHSATIDWGDGTTEPATVTDAGGTGTVAGSHAYSTSGTFPIVVTVSDDDGAATTSSTAVTINGAPTAGVGGPYSGVEGAPVSLTGTATDPDADALMIGWTSTVVTADAGTSCVLTGGTTLTPALTCDDDAVVSVTITVGDGVNPTVVDTTTVTIANADPLTATPNVSPNPVRFGSPVSLTTTFTDPGVNDNHSATINWGDTTSGSGAVSEVPGSGTVTGGHTYAAPGTYMATVTVNDKDGGKNSATVPVVVNAPPSVHAAGPYTGVEGTPMSLAGSATDADGDPLALSWSFAVATEPGAGCTMSGTATLYPTVTCTDDATITATLTASDGLNAPVTDTATITIANRAPGIGLVTVPVAPVPIGTTVTALTTFVDGGTNDTHTATVDWGDSTTSAGAVSETGGSGSAMGSHAYAAAGTYMVTVTITDDDHGTVTGTAAAHIVVFDGGSGFVTGGGWIVSPASAYTPNNGTDPGYVGRGEFGFVARKRASDPAPTGETEFELRLRQTKSRSGHEDEDCRRDDGWSKSPSFDFHSTSYTSLTVTGTTQAVYRGLGKVNGVSGYEFLVSVVDGRNTHTADKFRIKIWKTSTGEVLYDNQPGAADNALATSAVSGGSIVIHT
ncbi:MAG: PKD domain-containing protein [Acidimicrobiia bacterium]